MSSLRLAGLLKTAIQEQLASPSTNARHNRKHSISAQTVLGASAVEGRYDFLVLLSTVGLALALVRMMMEKQIVKQKVG